MGGRGPKSKTYIKKPNKHDTSSHVTKASKEGRGNDGLIVSRPMYMLQVMTSVIQSFRQN